MSGMPTSPVEGVAAFFGAYLPTRWRQIAGYTPHHEAFLLERGSDPLEEVVRRTCGIAAGLHRNAVLITEVRCEPRDDSWQIGYDALILLVEAEPEEVRPEILPLFSPLPAGSAVVPAVAQTGAWPMMDEDDWYGASL